MKFKVGDIVRIVNYGDASWDGHTAKVLAVPESLWDYYKIQYLNPSEEMLRISGPGLFSERELELVGISDAEILALDDAEMTDLARHLREWLNTRPQGGEMWMIAKGMVRQAYIDGYRKAQKNS